MAAMLPNFIFLLHTCVKFRSFYVATGLFLGTYYKGLSKGYAGFAVFNSIFV